MDKGIEALISKVKKQTESFDTVVLKEDEAKALIAALEQAQQEYQTIEQKLIKAAVYIETLESEPRKTNLKLLNEIAGLKRTCVELQASHYDLRESMGAIHNTIRGEGAHVSLSVLLTASKNAWDKSKSAAAITVEGSE